MLEVALLCLLAIPLTRFLRPVLSFCWRYLVDVIQRRMGEKID